MSEEKANEILESYQDDQNEKLLEQFESLKSKPFAYITSMLAIIIPLLFIHNFTEFDLFKNDNYVIILFIVIASGAGVAQSIQVNKRIDILASLLKNNAYSRNNT